MKIGFIGTGNIARPMVMSLANRFIEAEISVSQRSANVSSSLADQFDNVVVRDNQSVLDNCDIVIIALLATHARVELPKLKFQSHHKIVSVMSDLPISDLEFLVLPAREMCVTIPLPFIETGNCPLPVFPESAVLVQLFGDVNEIMPMPSEQAVSVHFAATAVLSSTMNQLRHVSEWLAEATNGGKNAERYVTLLLKGYLNSIPADGESRFVEAMDDLSTEGGLNLQLLAHIKSSGHFETLIEGLDELKKRLQS